MEIVTGEFVVFLGGVFGEFGHGGIEAGFLLGVVHFDNVSQGFLYIFLIFLGEFDFLHLGFFGVGAFHLSKAGFG